MLAEKAHPEKNQKYFRIVSMLSVVLLAIAYSTHLTTLEIDPRLDEIRRALVTLEMMLRDNYWVPTLNGEYYLNKPPLYNWLLALSYKTFGINEFALRMPVIVAIFWYGWVIYKFSSKYLGQNIATVAALLFITNGRILIYDSLVGLIDILYSSLVYLSFMLVYYYGKKEKWYHLFITTYLFVVIGYLMKGLPSLVYQAFVLMVFFIMEKKWKILFHKAHFVGFGIMAGLLGIYYYIYFSQVNLPPAELFTKIITESTIRTFKEDANWFKDFFIHFFSYPIVFTYHYAPWTLLLLLVIKKDWLRSLKSNGFVWFNALLFFACIFIYWFSPYIIARYMFMLLPLCFTVGAYYHEKEGQANKKFKRIIDYTLIIVIMLVGIGCLILPFLSFTSHLPGIWWKAVLVSILLVTSGFLAYKMPTIRLSFIILAIICSRFGFNWFVVEQRGKFSIEQRQEAEKVMQLANGRPIFLEKGANHGNSDGLSFNISLAQKRILPLTDSLHNNAVYITDSVTMIKRPHRIIYRWASQFQPNHYLVEYTGNEFN
jgi:4-amino-4-deoxy-L-arabinose transferase-like glycosyltransferase